MFTLTVVTPEKKVLAGQEIDEVFVPGYCGELNILPGHAPLLTTIDAGVLRYRLKGDSTMYVVAVSDGYCQVNPAGVNVLTETAERADELDIERVTQAQKDAEASLASGTLDPEHIAKAQAKITRARARLDVIRLGATHSSAKAHDKK